VVVVVVVVEVDVVVLVDVVDVVLSSVDDVSIETLLMLRVVKEDELISAVVDSCWLVAAAIAVVAETE
jgi:hypothetical protein